MYVTIGVRTSVRELPASISNPIRSASRHSPIHPCTSRQVALPMRRCTVRRIERIPPPQTQRHREVICGRPIWMIPRQGLVDQEPAPAAPQHGRPQNLRTPPAVRPATTTPALLVAVADPACAAVQVGGQQITCPYLGGSQARALRAVAEAREHRMTVGAPGQRVVHRNVTHHAAPRSVILPMSTPTRRDAVTRRLAYPACHSCGGSDLAHCHTSVIH